MLVTMEMMIITMVMMVAMVMLFAFRIILVSMTGYHGDFDYFSADSIHGGGANTAA